VFYHKIFSNKFNLLWTTTLFLQFHNFQSKAYIIHNLWWCHVTQSKGMQPYDSQLLSRHLVSPLSARLNWKGLKGGAGLTSWMPQPTLPLDHMATRPVMRHTPLSFHTSGFILGLLNLTWANCSIETLVHAALSKAVSNIQSRQGMLTETEGSVLLTF